MKEFIQLTRDRLTYAMILGDPGLPAPAVRLCDQQRSPAFADRRAGPGQQRLFPLGPRRTGTQRIFRRSTASGALAGRDRRIDPNAARCNSPSPFPATLPAAWCAATGRRSWSRPTPPIPPRRAARSPPSPPPAEALQHDLKGALAFAAAEPAAFRGRRPPPLQSGEHHRLQYRPGPARRSSCRSLW